MSDLSAAFLTKKRAAHIRVVAVTAAGLPAWLKKAPERVRNALAQGGFSGKPGQTALWVDDAGRLAGVLAGINKPLKLYDFANVADYIGRALSADILKGTSFEIEGLSKTDLETAYTGWGLAAYRFDAYKPSKKEIPALLAKPSAKTMAFLQSAFLLRDLVNTPANDMGPDDLAATAQRLAKEFGANIKIVRDATLKRDFPMVWAVGDSSERRPCLIDFTWGKAGAPKLTLVGKGVCFDTGGLDIKPSSAMAIMKKDMGGAAHALALSRMIMALKLPVRLRVIVPAVENAISGVAFRPGDIFTSRKGLTVENTNTDAEGRLILSDALTLASEEDPDLIIDFATLTGSARAGLGYDIPAFFSTNEGIAAKLQKTSLEQEDLVWPMPLWEPYRKYIDSSIADMVNSTNGVPGDLIYSALFLKSFLNGDPDWVHLDVSAWENSGRPGRPRGGADTGLRATFALIEDRYKKKR